MIWNLYTPDGKRVRFTGDRNAAIDRAREILDEPGSLTVTEPNGTITITAPYTTANVVIVESLVKQSPPDTRKTTKNTG